MDNQNKYRITKHQNELAVRITGNSQADLFVNSGLRAVRCHGRRRVRSK